jgi:Fe2+ or Zn2+ uptake regulation protein
MSAEPQTLALPVDDYGCACEIAAFVGANRDLQFNEILFAIDERWPDVSFRTVYAALALAVRDGYCASTEPRALC